MTDNLKILGIAKRIFAGVCSGEIDEFTFAKHQRTLADAAYPGDPKALSKFLDSPAGMITLQPRTTALSHVENVTKGLFSGALKLGLRTSPPSQNFRLPIESFGRWARNMRVNMA